MSSKAINGPAKLSLFDKITSHGNILHGLVKSNGDVYGLGNVKIGRIEVDGQIINAADLGPPVYLVDLPEKGPMPEDQSGLNALGYEVRDYAFISGKAGYSAKGRKGCFFYQLKNVPEGKKKTVKIRFYVDKIGYLDYIHMSANGKVIFTWYSDNFDQYHNEKYSGPFVPSPDGSKITIRKFSVVGGGMVYDNIGIHELTLANDSSGNISVSQSVIIEDTGVIIGAGVAPVWPVSYARGAGKTASEAMLGLSENQVQREADNASITGADYDINAGTYAYGYDKNNVFRYVDVVYPYGTCEITASGWTVFGPELVIDAVGENNDVWTAESKKTVLRKKVEICIVAGVTHTYTTEENHPIDGQVTFTSYGERASNNFQWDINNRGSGSFDGVSYVNFLTYKVETIAVGGGPGTFKQYAVSHTGVRIEIPTGKYAIWNPKTESFVITDSVYETII